MFQDNPNYWRRRRESPKVELSDKTKAIITAKLYFILQADVLGVELTDELEKKLWEIVKPWIDSFDK